MRLRGALPANSKATPYQKLKLGSSEQREERLERRKGITVLVPTLSNTSLYSHITQIYIPATRQTPLYVCVFT